jgi:hypothetical protein
MRCNGVFIEVTANFRQEYIDFTNGVYEAIKRDGHASPKMPPGLRKLIDEGLDLKALLEKHPPIPPPPMPGMTSGSHERSPTADEVANAIAPIALGRCDSDIFGASIALAKDEIDRLWFALFSFTLSQSLYWAGVANGLCNKQVSLDAMTQIHSRIVSQIPLRTRIYPVSYWVIMDAELGYVWNILSHQDIPYDLSSYPTTTLPFAFIALMILEQRLSRFITSSATMVAEMVKKESNFASMFPPVVTMTMASLILEQTSVRYAAAEQFRAKDFANVLSSTEKLVRD